MCIYIYVYFSGNNTWKTQVMTSFIYPIVVSATWGGGWLALEGGAGAGYMDFAGSGAVAAVDVGPG